MLLLDDLAVFDKVAGRHMILVASKSPGDRPTLVKRVLHGSPAQAEAYLSGRLPVVEYEKTAGQLFRHNRLDLEPPADGILAKLERWPRLCEMGIVRQGIAENPAAINARTNARFDNRWSVGEGVFALAEAEVEKLGLDAEERTLLRPYYDLCDVGRWWLALRPSLRLIYSTKQTWPDIARYPRLRTHLERFRPIMDCRRETVSGANSWWHLHWPRDEAVWQAPKILCRQFAPRPAAVVATDPAYVPFSTNVFVPSEGTREGLDYLSALLNSRLLWKWYRHHAKRRGGGPGDQRPGAGTDADPADRFCSRGRSPVGTGDCHAGPGVVPAQPPTAGREYSPGKGVAGRTVCRGGRPVGPPGLPNYMPCRKRKSPWSRQASTIDRPPRDIAGPANPH